MPLRRTAFSLIELLIVLGIVVLLAGAAHWAMGEDPGEARYAIAEAELHKFRKLVQARAMTTAGYHFATLEQALGLDRAPLDPWGEPYFLVHEGFPGESTTKDKLGARIATSCSTAGSHWIRSAGPSISSLPELGRADRLAVKIKLGPPPPAQELVPPPEVFRTRVFKSDVILKIFGVTPGDTSQIVLVLNGLPLLSPMGMAPFPGVPVGVTLRPGMNLVTVRVQSVGPIPFATVGLSVNHVLEGHSQEKLQILPGEERHWEIIAPSS